MVQLLRLLCGALIGLLRSTARREAEILVLRHQINVLRRKSPSRPALSNVDRLLFVLLFRLLPTTLDALTVIRPDTVIRWHRAGFRAYWRWKSRPRGGRPRTHPDIRQLIRDMSIANPLWGAPRIQVRAGGGATPAQGSLEDHKLPSAKGNAEEHSEGQRRWNDHRPRFNRN